MFHYVIRRLLWLVPTIGTRLALGAVGLALFAAALDYVLLPGRRDLEVDREIGATLYITAGTVKTHLANIQQKLGVRNRVGVAAWAWETGHHRRLGLESPGPTNAQPPGTPS